MFTAKDKIAKLQRLIRQIDEWDSQRDLGPIFRMGKPPLSVNSDDFQEWRRRVRNVISLVFGEHSHYIDDFNEIAYTDIFDHLSGLAGEKKTRIWKGLEEAKRLLQTMIDEINESQQSSSPTTSKSRDGISVIRPTVFIGHGRNPLWARLQLYLQDELGLSVINFESESRTGESVVAILTKMLGEASFAILLLTAEDETANGSMRARQNVIHEVGLFQSKLGFNKAILLKQEGVEDFTNVAGLQYIPFSDNKIEQSFYELRRTLAREGLIS
ncbi:MAG: TIR domain-containing protein [Pyrinomonadaceae bacterium]